MRAFNRFRGRRAFSLVELLIVMGLAAILMTGLFAVMAPQPPTLIAHGDMDRLARWLEWAMVRSGRWRNGFYLTIAAPSVPGQPNFIELQWHNSRENQPLEKERFLADAELRWHVQGYTYSFAYNGDLQSLTPAMTLLALTQQGEVTGESLVISARGLVTRHCRCGD